jgi:hypothetical protein
MATNELYNIDISKIMKNPDMKPRKNPIHINFVDKQEKVFSKFDISDNDYLGHGGHNIVYKSDNFTLRISRSVFDTDDEPMDQNKFISKSQKTRDEEVLRKAIKHGLSPRVYLLSNIEMDGKIHRYCIMESYDITLSKFIRQRKMNNIVKLEQCHYGNVDSICSDISEQLMDLSERVTDIGIVYYDFKPDNVVMNIDSVTGKVSLKLIDWDGEFCIEESWAHEYRDTITFLNLTICAYYLYYYYNCNILCKTVRQLYSREKIYKIFEIFSKYGNQYITIILHYFHRSFGMSELEKDSFDEKKNDDMKRLEKKICHMIKCGTRLSNQSQEEFPYN